MLEIDEEEVVEMEVSKSGAPGPTYHRIQIRSRGRKYPRLAGAKLFTESMTCHLQVLSGVVGPSNSVLFY